MQQANNNKRATKKMSETLRARKNYSKLNNNDKTARTKEQPYSHTAAAQPDEKLASKCLYVGFDFLKRISTLIVVAVCVVSLFSLVSPMYA